MKATLKYDGVDEPLEFSLPDERHEFILAVHGSNWADAMWDLDNSYLREWVRHGHNFKDADEALEAVRAKLRECMSDNGVDFGMIY